MKCYLCGKDIGDKLGTCEECSKAREQQQEEDKAEMENARPAKIAERPENNLAVILTYVFPVLLVAFLIALYELLKPPIIVPELQLVSSISAVDPCLGKEKCLICYVSPWCPACKSSVPTIQAMRDAIGRSSNVGMKIIIGDDELPAIQSYASTIGGLVYYDPESKFKKDVGTGAIPYLLVMNEKREVLASNSGLPASASEEDLKALLEDVDIQL